MSLIKEKIAIDEYYHNLANQILKKIGAIRYCACGEFYWSMGVGPIKSLCNCNNRV